MTDHPTILPGQRLRARGADSNRAGRFEATDREAFDDGWDLAEEERLVATEVRVERPRSALTFNRSPEQFKEWVEEREEELRKLLKK